MPKSREQVLHETSVILGKLFRDAYERCGRDHPLTQELLERYRNTRRQLPGSGNDGANHSTRYGAYEAYQSTQEG